MVDDGDYELLPYKELEELRSELNAIKRNPLRGYEKADDLKSSIDQLNSSIQDLIKLFSNTNDELIKNFRKDTIEAHFERLSSQNEKLAKGILAVAKLVDSKLSSSKPDSEKASDSEKVMPVSNNMSDNSSIDPQTIPHQNDLSMSQSSGSFGQAQTSFEDKNNLSVPSETNPVGSSQQASGQPHPLNSANLNSSIGTDSQLNSGLPSQNVSSQNDSTITPANSSVNSPASSNDLPPLDMDLPPPPKKSGILGIFK